MSLSDSILCCLAAATTLGCVVVFNLRRQLCLIDPICFAMFMPNLLRCVVGGGWLVLVGSGCIFQRTNLTVLLLVRQKPTHLTDPDTTCMRSPACHPPCWLSPRRNFLYESPNSGSWLGDFMMVSAARDLHVSATLSRRFFWSGELLLGAHAMVCWSLTVLWRGVAG